MDTSKKYTGQDLLDLIHDEQFNFMRDPHVVIADLVSVIRELQIRLTLIESKDIRFG